MRGFHYDGFAAYENLDSYSRCYGGRRDSGLGRTLTQFGLLAECNRCQQQAGLFRASKINGSPWKEAGSGTVGCSIGESNRTLLPVLRLFVGQQIGDRGHWLPRTVACGGVCTLIWYRESRRLSLQG